MSDVISIISSQKGVGKTNTAFNLAIFFNYMGYKVKLVSPELKEKFLNVEDNPISFVEFDELIFELVSEEEDIVIIIDLPSVFSNRSKEILKVSNYVIIPVKSQDINMMCLKATENLVLEAMQNAPNIQAGILFNMVKGYYNTMQEVQTLMYYQSLPIIKRWIINSEYNGLNNDKIDPFEFDNIEKFDFMCVGLDISKMLDE